MDKNSIKKYAVWARTELIERVSKKADEYEVSADADPNADSARGVLLTETKKKQRVALISKVKEKGFEQVMEEVAYTWFNRFSALRFMEVNNYLPSRVRVFTDADGAFKPQILKEAIHMELKGLDIEKVYALKEANNNDELFKYLIITQCNALSEVLPGMFQKISDYTELLFPDNLLREGSVIERMVVQGKSDSIPEDDWKDQIQIIGWLYQYYNIETFDSIFDGDMSRNKVTKELLPAATEIFTPDWVVKYMVENSLGRLWVEHIQGVGGGITFPLHFLLSSEDVETHVNKVKANWTYYLDEAEQEPEVQKQLAEIRKEYAALKPEGIRCIDPCSGSGHILAYMFDVLVQIYADYGIQTRDAVRSIIESNLWGLDIDKRAAQLAYFSVMMKAVQYDSRFLRRKGENGIPDIPQPHIYAIRESNHLDSFALEYFVNDNAGLKKDVDALIEDLHDAKEYGSLIDIENVNFDALYNRFAEISSDISIYRFTVEEDLLPLVNVAFALSQEYHVTITNPPYLGNSRMNVKLGDYIKKYYPDEKNDLAIAMLNRVVWKFTKRNYFSSAITTVSWMYLKNFESFRTKLIHDSDFVCLTDFGTELFEGKIGHLPIASWVSRNSNVDTEFISLRLVDYCYSRRDEKLMEYFNEKNRYVVKQSDFFKIPSAPIAYWLTDNAFSIFLDNKSFENYATTRAGMITGDNNDFMRAWHEVEFPKLGLGLTSREDAIESKKKWFPYSKGGDFRRWYGNNDFVVNWYNDGFEMRNRKDKKGNIPAHAFNLEYIFKENICWNSISTNTFSARYTKCGYLYDAGGSFASVRHDNAKYFLGYLNSCVAFYYLQALNPTLNFQKGNVSNLPIVIATDTDKKNIEKIVDSCIEMSTTDWDSHETSWGFKQHPLILYKSGSGYISNAYSLWEETASVRFDLIKKNEEELNRLFIKVYGLQKELTPEVTTKDVTVRKADLERDIQSFISYAVGCMFGRYSLDVPGLIYAGGDFVTKYCRWISRFGDKADEEIDENGHLIHGGWAGSSLAKYDGIRKDGHWILASFAPDTDGILPICDDEYFDDDITGRFVKFVETVYGKETLEENLKFIADALGGNGSPREVIRNYFLNDFYADHVKTYQKRPIYWLFDSGKKNGFKCLIYMHRYQPDTIARIRTDYVHEQQARYRTAIAGLERQIVDAPTSERVRLNKQLTKLKDQAEETRKYEEKIHHLADQMISIDLDDGVKHNYAIFKDVLAKIK